jgi:transposase
LARSKTSKSERPAGSQGAPSFVAPGALPVPRELLSAGVDLDAAHEIERQRRMEELKAELTRMVSSGNGASAIDRVMAMMLELERENERLAWRVLRANRYRFGRSTEKLSPEQLQQLYLALGGEPATVAPDGGLTVPAPPEPEQTDDDASGGSTAQTQDETGSGAQKKRRRRVRAMTASKDVERIVRPVAVPQEERTCAICGKVKVVFGHVDHERIEFIPAKIVVHVERREKMACDDCHKDVTVARREQAPAVVRKVGASLLGKLVSDKCSMAMPVDRQRRELLQLGLDVPPKTLQSYWAYTLDLLEPVAEVTRAGVFSAPIVGADDSVLKTLDKTAPGGLFRAHLWCFVGTDGTVGGPETVAYGYTPSWEATEVTDWFSAIDGAIQCDGYAGYAREVEDDDGQTLVAVPPDRRLGCGMHIRSKFHAALMAKDHRAAIPLKHFADLYQIEADCKERGLNAEARGRERQRRSLPILDALERWVDAIHAKLLPRSQLRRATTYALSQREFFRRCFTDGRFEIDNGRVERRIRTFAVGRRNFLFTGSERGGHRIAVAYTLVENCTLLRVDPYAYLVDVITKIEAGWPMSRLSDLTPQRWAAQQPRQNGAQ